MNPGIKSAGLIALIGIFSTTAQPADITDNYNSGDTLSATQMNNIKDAVNSKQDRITGSCSPGESIRAIAADGSVTCEVDDAPPAPLNSITAGGGLTAEGTASDPILRQADGAANVTWLSMKTMTSGCVVEYTSEYARPSASGTGGCFFQMPIHLPDGATIDSMLCTASVDVAKAGLSFQLRRIEFSGFSSATILRAGGLSGLGVGNRETVVTTNPFGSTLITNSTYMYFIDTTYLAISVDPGEFRFYGCSVFYSY